MKFNSEFYIGRDSKGTFKWNEKQLIYIEPTKTPTNANNSKNKNNKPK